MAILKPLSWTCQMSATDAGIRASKGAIQKPWTVLAAANEPKLFTSAAQKHDTANPSVVSKYTGLFPTLTANALQMRLPAAIATIQDPLAPVEELLSSRSQRS
jgi:hypothetical protein